VGHANVEGWRVGGSGAGAGGVLDIDHGTSAATDDGIDG